MGRPAGQPIDGADVPATPRSLRRWAKRAFRTWFGREWERRDEVLLFPERARSETARHRERERQHARKVREARREVAAVVVELTKAERAATRSLSRLRAATTEGAEVRARLERELVTGRHDAGDEDAREVGLDVLADVLDAIGRVRVRLPDTRKVGRAGRLDSRRRTVLRWGVVGVERPLQDRELAVVGILCGLDLDARDGETVADVVRRARNAYAAMRRRINDDVT